MQQQKGSNKSSIKWLQSFDGNNLIPTTTLLQRDSFFEDCDIWKKLVFGQKVTLGDVT